MPYIEYTFASAPRDLVVSSSEFMQEDKETPIIKVRATIQILNLAIFIVL